MGPGKETKRVLRVRIDASRCDGQGVCKTVAPELFELDRYGYAYVVRERRDLDPEDRALVDTARDAESMCPRAAIFLERLVAGAGGADPAGASSGVGVREAPPAGRLLVSGEGPLRESLEAWQAQGGFARRSPGELRGEVRTARLRGQGGAGYPVASKWAALASPGAILVVNAAEREPGTVKDAYLLVNRPFLVLDGALAAAHDTGAKRVVIALPEGEQDVKAALEAACRQLESAGLSDGFRIQVAEVPRSYVAGEETALLAALQDQPVKPRLRPPYPAQSGLYGGPTLVHNIETLAQVALVNARGGEWHLETGTDAEPGTGLFSVGMYGSGDFEVLERPIGYPLGELIAEAGLAEGAAGALVGGFSGGLLRPDQFGAGLDNRSLAPLGARLGTKSIQVLPESKCPLRVVVEVLDFFSQETAAQCPPCYRGLPDMRDIAATIEEGRAGAGAAEDFHTYMSTLGGRNICALPDGAAVMAMSYMQNFSADLAEHLQGGCPHRRATLNYKKVSA